MLTVTLFDKNTVKLYYSEILLFKIIFAYYNIF